MNMPEWLKWTIAVVGLVGFALAAVIAIHYTAPPKADCVIDLRPGEVRCYLRVEGATVKVPCPRADPGVM